MSDNHSPLNVQIPNQGWKQFLTARDEMLAAYDKARTLSAKKAVQTSHGVVAEAELRQWLINFLPKRYGVTSGYNISQGNELLKSQLNSSGVPLQSRYPLQQPILQKLMSLGLRKYIITKC